MKIFSRLLVCLFLLCGLHGTSQTYHFKHFSEKEGLNNAFIYDITQGKNGLIWATCGIGLFNFNGIEWKQVFHIDDFGHAPFVKTAWHNEALFTISNNGLVLKTENGKTKKWFSIKHEFLLKNFWIDQNGIHTFYQDGTYKHFNYTGKEINTLKLKGNFKFSYRSENGLIIQYSSHSIEIIEDIVYEYDLSSPSWQQKHQESTALHTLVNVTDITSGEKLNFIATTEGIHVYQKDYAKDSYVFNSYNGLGSSDVRTTYYDNEGTLWVGTFGFGVYALPKFHSVIYPYKDGMRNISVINSKLYCSTDDSIIVYDFDSQSYSPQLYKTNSYPLKRSSSFEDVEGSVIITTRGSGAFKLYNDIITPLNIPNKLKSVNNLKYADNKLYWCTPYNGVIITDLDFNIIKEYNTTNGLAHNDINNIHLENGNTWFLSNGSGVQKMSNHNISQSIEIESASYNNAINAIDTDQGTLIATEGAGCILVSDTNVSYLYSELKGLPEFTYSICKTTEHVVVSSSKSILLLNKQLNRIENDIETGLNMVNSAIVKLTDNAILVSSADGLILVNIPSEKSYPKATILIESFESNGTIYSHLNKIELGYDEHNVRVNLNAISPNHAGNILFSYKLDGYDTEWSAPTTDRFIKYPKLKEGDYVLKIKPIIPYGETIFDITEVNFSIKSPYWKSTVFIVITICAVIILVLIIIEIRTRNIKKYSRSLRYLVGKRTSELKTQNARLEEYTYAISHDLKNPVINIKGLADILKEEDVDETERLEVLGMLSSSTDNLYQNLLGLIDAIKAGQHNPDTSESVSLTELIKDIQTSMSFDLKETHGEIICHLDEKYVIFDKQNMHSILYNIISNAVKYRNPDKAPSIHITSNKVLDGIEISVRDNGLGMDIDKHEEQLFGMFRRLHNHVEGSGMGMYLVNAMVERTGGKIDVKSKIGFGTTITVFIPQSESI